MSSIMLAPGADGVEMALLLLAGVDGSLCVRRVSRRRDGKISCVLLCYLEGMSGSLGCPITSIDYHVATDSVLLGDAGCIVSLVSPLRSHLGSLPDASPASPSNMPGIVGVGAAVAAHVAASVTSSASTIGAPDAVTADAQSTSVPAEETVAKSNSSSMPPTPVSPISDAPAVHTPSIAELAMAQQSLAGDGMTASQNASAPRDPAGVGADPYPVFSG